MTEQKRVFFCLFLRGEFYGALPSEAAAVNAYDMAIERWATRHGHKNYWLAGEALGHLSIVPRMMTRRELEDIKDDEVSDAEWDAASEIYDGVIPL